MTATEILDVLDKLHALRHVRAISPEDYAARKAYLLGLLDGAIGYEAPVAAAESTSETDVATDTAPDDASGTPVAVGGRRRAPGISPNIAVAMLLVVAAIVGVVAFTLGRSVPADEPAAGRPAAVVSAPSTAGG